MRVALQHVYVLAFYIAVAALGLLVSYPGASADAIRALLRHGFEVAAVFTHRDDPGENTWFESVADGPRAVRCKMTSSMICGAHIMRESGFSSNSSQSRRRI